MTMPQHDREPTWEFVRQVNRHQCNLPQRQHQAATFVVGDVIRCKGCSQTYQLSDLNYGDQREPINPPALRWVKA